MSIKALSEELINKIAAGEVISRPSCVVRELIDNSLDSGAGKIDVALNFEEDLTIRVSDDGRGIAADDIELACKRHYTSKIQELKDIFLTPTRGFRGEALASIASISFLMLTSSSNDSGLGESVALEGGKVMGRKKVNAPRGTTVKVSRLFYNTPVREKFLRSLAYEKSLVKNEIISYALANPSIAFRLFDIKRGVQQVVLNLAGGTSPSSLYQRILAFFPRLSGKEDLLKIDAEWENFNLKGYISSHTVRYRSRGSEYLFMRNKRIESSIFLRAAREAYGHFLPSKTYPQVFLTLSSSDPLAIDFNVHPAKKTIAVQDSQTFYRAIYHPLRHRLHQGMQQTLLPDGVGNGEDVKDERAKHEAYRNWLVRNKEKKRSGLPLEDVSRLDNADASSNAKAIVLDEDQPQQSLDKDGAESQQEVRSSGGKIDDGKSNGDGRADDDRSYGNTQDPSILNAEKIDLANNNTTNRERGEESESKDDAEIDLKSDKDVALVQKKENSSTNSLRGGEPCVVLGQIAKLYIVFMLGNALYIMDQHAAHERVNYDRILAKIASGGLECDPLLIPLVMHCDVQAIGKLELPEVRQALLQLGVDYDAVGDAEVGFNTFPALVSERARVRVARELIGAAVDLVDESGVADTTSFQDNFLRETVARMACRISVMSGDTLTSGEMQDLVNHIVEKNYQVTCPHGRPFVRRISLSEMDSFFERNRHIKSSSS